MEWLERLWDRPCEVISRNKYPPEKVLSAGSGSVRTDLTFGLSHVEMSDRLDKHSFGELMGVLSRK